MSRNFSKNCFQSDIIFACYFQYIEIVEGAIRFALAMPPAPLWRVSIDGKLIPRDVWMHVELDKAEAFKHIIPIEVFALLWYQAYVTIYVLRMI